MSEQNLQSNIMTDTSSSAIDDLFEPTNVMETFDDINFSDYVADHDNDDLSSVLDVYLQKVQNQCSNTSSSPTSVTELISQPLVPDISVVNNVIVGDGQVFEDVWDPDWLCVSHEEVVVLEDLLPDTNETPQEIYRENEIDPFALIFGTMSIKEQPKAEKRARYKSDGIRFLPDARKHPMSIQLPDLSAKALFDDETFGITVAMVTTTDNPRNKTFVHVNELKYYADDAIEIGDGSIFVPITGSDTKKCEKTLPRLSISCKKFDEYDFVLRPFDTLELEEIPEIYTHKNEDRIGKVAKGKLFSMDYNLCCYKIVCKLAFKRKNSILVSPIQCETNIVNEEKTCNSVKRKASPVEKGSKRRKMNDSHYHNEESEMSGVDSDYSSVDGPAKPKRRANRSKRSSKGSS